MEIHFDLNRHLVATCQLRLEDSATFESLGYDPSLVFKPDLPLPVGWYSIRVEASLPPGSSPRIYLDFGQGFQEIFSAALWRFDSHYEALVRVPDLLQLIRLDPTDRPGKIFIAKFNARRLSEGEYLLRRAKHIGWQGLITRGIDLLTGRRPGIISIRDAFTAADPVAGVPTANGYQAWIERHDFNRLRDRDILVAKLAKLQEQPLLSVVMPVYNTPSQLLDEVIRSVVDQVYGNWELCIANDASPEPRIKPQLEAWVKKDRRIKVVHRSENGHISRSSNSAIQLATGSWIVLLDHDDLLPPHALAEIAIAVNEHPHVQMIYSDEDKVDERGNRFDPYFKSDWNYDLFLSQNMFSHLGAYRADLIRAVGGFRLGFEGAQDYDLALRCMEKAGQSAIHHIPKVLYHWRVIPGSTSLNADEKPYAMVAGERAIQEHLDRTGRSGEAELIGFGYRVRYALPSPRPKTSVIIPTRNGYALLKRCIDSILKCSSAPEEIIVVDNQSDEAETLDYLRTINGQANVLRVLKYDSIFNYSAINNFAVEAAAGDIVILLNNDVEILTDNWLELLVANALRPDIGAVGARLWYPDNTLQHAGLGLSPQHIATNLHKGMPRGQHGYFGRATLQHRVSAVTAACLAIQKARYVAVGGMNERDLPVAYNDVDFCLRLLEQGYANLVVPEVELYHYESATRGHDKTDAKAERLAREKAFMTQRWGHLLTNDPMLSPNLDRDRDDFRILV